MPFVGLTSVAGIIIELGPLSISISMVWTVWGSALLLFNMKSIFLLLFNGDGDRDKGGFRSIRLADDGESSFVTEDASLKFSMS